MSPQQVSLARKAASLCCAASLGALLFSVRVALTIFQELPNDRLLAGRIAGRSFTGAYAIATAAAVIAVVVVVTTRSRHRLIDVWCAWSLLVTSLLQLFWIAPAIARHGSGWPGSFASLHAAGGIFHVFMAVLALVLAWRLLEPVDDGVAASDQRF